MIFSSSPKGTPHDRCRRTMKDLTLQRKPIELGSLPQKMDEASPRGLYSMYFVLQGIEPLTCVKACVKICKDMCPQFGGWLPWMFEAPQLEQLKRNGCFKIITS